MAFAPYVRDEQSHAIINKDEEKLKRFNLDRELLNEINRLKQYTLDLEKRISILEKKDIDENAAPSINS